MEEVLKMLGPWPVLQFLFGIGILGFGIYMIVRGTQKENTPLIEDKRAEWLAYEHLRNIEENTFKMVEYLRQLKESTDRLTSVLWNKDKL